MALAAAIRVDRESFEREGYLVIEDVFDPAVDLDPVVQEYTARLDELAADWHASGRIDSTYADLPFVERFAHVLNDPGRRATRRSTSRCQARSARIRRCIRAQQYLA